jgi:hypothetical protein
VLVWEIGSAARQYRLESKRKNDQRLHLLSGFSDLCKLGKPYVELNRYSVYSNHIHICLLWQVGIIDLPNKVLDAHLAHCVIGRKLRFQFLIKLEIRNIPLFSLSEPNVNFYV